MLLLPKPLIPLQNTKAAESQSGERPPSEVRVTEDQYRAIFDRYPHPAFILDRATLRILAANETAIDYYGYSHDEFLAMSYTDLHLSEDGMDVRQKLGQYSGSRGASHWRQRMKSGSLARVHVIWRPVPFDRIPAILMVTESTPRAIGRLLNETEEGRNRLVALSRRLVELQEMERAEIAREIHDEIGQLLTGLKLMIAAGAYQEGPDAGPQRQPASRREDMAAIVNELIGRLRDLSMNLRPPMLDEIGLVPALRWHFERYTARTRVRVSFQETVDGRRFPAAVEIAAFRIIQEALTNVARHADVQEVDVEVKFDREGLSLLIEDKGQGFNQKMAPSGRSAGIIGMQERASLVGGNLTLESAVSTGTRIAVVLPLRNREERRQEER